MKTESIRVKATSGEWKSFQCQILERDFSGLADIAVPALDGKWTIQPSGMLANVGGNDWRIYTLHPDDCARICGVDKGGAIIA